MYTASAASRFAKIGLPGRAFGCREARKLTGVFAVLLPRLNGTEHALAHRIYTCSTICHRAMTLAADQSAEFRAR
jgi:hypothetical protein